MEVDLVTGGVAGTHSFTFYDSGSTYAGIGFNMIQYFMNDVPFSFIAYTDSMTEIMGMVTIFHLRYFFKKQRIMLKITCLTSITS